MKHLVKISAISALLLFASNGWAYNETDLLKFKALNVCAGCDLSDADLSKAQLSEANLSGANLIRADLRGVNLRGANLQNADLRGVSLRDINLTTTILKNANLDGAKFCKTQMAWGEVNDDCENAD